MRALDPRIIEKLKTGTPEERLYICKREPVYFNVYYFPEYFTYPIAPFHYDLYDDCKGLTAGTLKEADWTIYRESAKTSIAKTALVCRAICFKLKRYINWDSYDKGNSEAALFDIALALQTNPRIIADFGQLYFKAKGDQNSSMKRISNFLTENGVRVEAFSTQESTRGRVFGNYRPDLYVFDDIETSKTKDSYAITNQIKKHIDEARSGLGVNGSIAYLNNYISEEGVVASIIQSLKGRSDCVVRNIPVEIGGTFEHMGEPTWPGKFVKTKAEAAKANIGITDALRRKVSLEAKREELGKATFETEMLNNPSKSDDLIFDREIIDRLILKAAAPKQNIAGFKIWHPYNPSHRYTWGADTAEGIEQDSCTTAFIDHTTIPARLVADYEDNAIAPDNFAYEIKREAEMFGLPYGAPETNNTGFATLAILKKIYPPGKIHQRRQEDKTKNIVVPEWGWRSTQQTKPEIVFQFKEAVESGSLEILDVDLLNECKYFRRRDIRMLKKEQGMTRHFDKLIAASIAWAMRNYAPASNPKAAEYKQPAYEPMSRFEAKGMK